MSGEASHRQFPRPRQRRRRRRLDLRRRLLNARAALWRTADLRAVKPKLPVVAEFHPDAVEIEERAPPRVARLTLYSVVALMLAAVIWASLVARGYDRDGARKADHDHGEPCCAAAGNVGHPRYQGQSRRHREPWSGAGLTRSDLFAGRSG